MASDRLVSMRQSFLSSFRGAREAREPGIHNRRKTRFGRCGELDNKTAARIMVP